MEVSSFVVLFNTNRGEEKRTEGARFGVNSVGIVILELLDGEVVWGRGIYRGFEDLGVRDLEVRKKVNSENES